MTDKEKKFLAAAKQLFDQSLREIDDSTSARLTQVRQRALSRTPATGRRWFVWGALPAAGLAALLAVLLFRPAQQGPLQNSSVADLGIITAEESLEFYEEEIEFYQWLSEVTEDEKELSRLDSGAPDSAAAEFCSGPADDAERGTERRNARISRLI